MGEAWEARGHARDSARRRRTRLRPPVISPPPTLTQTRNGRPRRPPFPFSLLPSQYSSSPPPVVLVCVYFILFFLNLCRPPFSTSSRPKEQSLGSRSTVPGYPFSTSRRRSSSRTTSEKPTTLTSSFTIPPIRVRTRIRATSDHVSLTSLALYLLLLGSHQLCNHRVQR